MSRRAIILSIIFIFLVAAGCSGSGGVTPERGSAVVGIIGSPGEFPELDTVAANLEEQFGSVKYIEPGEYPAGMSCLLITGISGDERHNRIRNEYFDKRGVPPDQWDPGRMAFRLHIRERNIRAVGLIAMNRAELRNWLRYMNDEFAKGRRFDFEGGEWRMHCREIAADEVAPSEREAQWGTYAHQRMSEIAVVEMGYDTKVRKDAGQAYAIDFYYNDELKYTSYVAGNETPMQLLIRGAWECDIIHDKLFEGVFENLLYRKLGHAWFPPNGDPGLADDFAWTYGVAAAWRFIWDKEGPAYYYLGLTMHLIEDVGIPLHTKLNILDQILYHTAIENDLDEFWYEEIDYGIHDQPIHSFTDLKGAIAELGTASNQDFDDLISGYVWGWLFGYDDYYNVARNSAARTMSYVKGLLQLAEPYTG